MKKNIKLVLLILWMGFIFYMSAQVGQASTKQTNVVMKILYSIYNLIFKDAGLDYLSFSTKYFTLIRKMAHFTEFGVLGVLMYLNVIEYRKNRLVLISIILCLLYAISDEVHQIFVPNRACTIFDMFIDTSGASLFIILIHLIYERCIKK